MQNEYQAIRMMTIPFLIKQPIFIVPLRIIQDFIPRVDNVSIRCERPKKGKRFYQYMLLSAELDP